MSNPQQLPTLLRLKPFSRTAPLMPAFPMPLLRQLCVPLPQARLPSAKFRPSACSAVDRIHLTEVQEVAEDHCQDKAARDR